MKIHRLEIGSNPQPWVQKASDKPTTPPSRLFAGTSSEELSVSASPLSQLVDSIINPKPLEGSELLFSRQF
ncbi:hypothetical protein TNCV_4984691 [Trichonephila clavipes]|nr:hypothetical protein TNCV_4984691 [Trichonephila clavipes]